MVLWTVRVLVGAGRDILVARPPARPPDLPPLLAASAASGVIKRLDRKNADATADVDMIFSKSSLLDFASNATFGLFATLDGTNADAEEKRRKKMIDFMVTGYVVGR